MVRSMFAAISGLKSHQTRMDVISNNIANVNTWGFKSQNANFTDTLYQNLKMGRAPGNGMGGMNASQLGFGVDVGTITADFTTGSRSYTGRANELMIDGSAFFIVGPMRGDPANPDPITGTDGKLTAQDGVQLSRVGILSKDADGYLVDDAGNYVYGFAVNEDGKTFDTTQLVPIKCKTGDNGTEDYSSISFQADGTITGVTDDGKVEVIGQIAVANVSNVNGLEKSSGYYYNIGENAGDVTFLQTTQYTGNILSGYLEMSNTNLANEMANMIITQRGYQANTKMITVTDEMLQELVSMKR